MSGPQNYFLTAKIDENSNNSGTQSDFDENESEFDETCSELIVFFYQELHDTTQNPAKPQTHQN